jgi:ABC-2 type transport system permease protein
VLRRRSGWLERLSDFMPIRHVVDAVRNAFFGDFDASTMSWGIGWTALVFGASVWWGVRVFQKENA